MTAGTVIEALGDPVRRQVVTLLSGGPRRAGEIAAEIGMSAPAISRHLRVLLEALVIEDERLRSGRAGAGVPAPAAVDHGRAGMAGRDPGGRTEASGAPASCGFGRITTPLV